MHFLKNELVVFAVMWEKPAAPMRVEISTFVYSAALQKAFRITNTTVCVSRIQGCQMSPRGGRWKEPRNKRWLSARTSGLFLSVDETWRTKVWTSSTAEANFEHLLVRNHQPQWFLSENGPKLWRGAQEKKMWMDQQAANPLPSSAGDEENMVQML